MSSNKIRQILYSAVCLLLAGCASTPATDTPPTTDVPPSTSTSPAPVDSQATAPASTAEQATARAIAVATIEANWTSTAQAPKPSPTSTSTNTPIPTALPTATPSGPLSSSGPWLIGRSVSTDYETYLWAANPDMSGLTQLISEPIIAYAIRPTDTVAGGLTIAYVTRPFYESVDITLKIVTLPGGTPQTIASLYQAARDSTFYKYILEEALADDGLVWSPDGRTLAFVGGLDGISVNLYTYSLDTGEIRQLSDGALHAYQLGWSPDGRYIVYEGFGAIGMGGPYTEATWAVPVGGGENISLIDEELSNLYRSYTQIYGWLNSTKILLGTTYSDSGVKDSIQTFDIETGTIDYLAYAQYDYGVYSPEYQTWLLTRAYDEVETLGTALILCRDRDCQVVSSLEISSVRWSGAQKAFFGMSRDGGLYKITPAGEVTKLPIRLDASIGRPPFFTESPNGTLWAWHDWVDMAGSTKVYLGAAMAQPRVIQDQAYSILWSPDSQHLLLFSESSVMVASSPDFKPALAVEGWSVVDTTWVP